MAITPTGNQSLRRAAANPELELLERLGYFVRGVLYAVIGLLALRMALRQPGGEATDLPGSVVFLIGNPFGKLVLIVVIVGLAAYSVWGFVRAIFDPLHRGSDPSCYMQRLGFVSSGVFYAAVVLFGLQILAGSANAPTKSTQKSITSLLNHPAGGAQSPSVSSR